MIKCREVCNHVASKKETHTKKQMAHNSLTRKHQKMNDRKTKAIFSLCVQVEVVTAQFLPYLYFHFSEPGELFLKTISRNDEKAYLREFFLLKNKNGQTNKLYF